MAQASIDTRSGRAPFSVESGRSSTAARIAMPIRGRVSTRRRMMATSDRDADGDRLVDRDRRRRRGRSAPGRAKKLAIGRLTPGLPDQLGEPDHEQQQRDRDDELHRLGRVLQPAHDHGFEQHAEQRGEDHEHHEERDRRGPAPVEAQLPVREREQHPGRAVGEVEDAGRRVGEHETAGDDRVDRRDRQADNREGQELVHGLPVGPVSARLGIVEEAARPPHGSGYFRSAMLLPDVGEGHALAVVALEHVHVLRVAVEDAVVRADVRELEAARRRLLDGEARRRRAAPPGSARRAARRRSTT